MGSGTCWSSRETMKTIEAYISASGNSRHGNKWKNELFAAQVLERCNKNFERKLCKNLNTVYTNPNGDAIMQRF